MQSDELDDLFRQELDGHATPPAADLWARLQVRTAAEATPPADPNPLDAQFRARLAGHATPPRRELWERLEDEHLRPRPRRPVVAWGRLAVAASLLLLMLAGGAGLWWSYRSPAAGPVATTHPAARGAASSGAATTSRQPAGTVAASSAKRKTAPEPTASAFANELVSRQQSTNAPAAVAAKIGQAPKSRKFFTAQATSPGGSASSGPVASTAAQHRPATVPHPVPGLPQNAPLPDAAAATQLAQHGGRTTPGRQPTTQPETSALAATSPQVIEVEVRRGLLGRPAAEAVAAAPAEPDAASPRRFRLGGLLRQAGRAVRGEPVSLAEATGLPEALTLQAQLGDRVVVKTIRL